MSEQPFRDGLRRIGEVRDRIADEIMGIRDVVACGIGFKQRAGRRLNEPAIVISVKEKKPADALSIGDLIPDVIEGFLTDVIETGEVAEMSRMSEVRPAQPGLSIGHIEGSAGTFGCVVERDGQSYILSNNHVLAMRNYAEIGDAILQPGPGDGGTFPDDQIGTLAAFQPLAYLKKSTPAVEGQSTGETQQGCLPLLTNFFGGGSQRTLYNRIDAALASPLSPDVINAYILEVGIPRGTAPAALGERVFKSGRTSGLTDGTIQQVAVTIDVAFETGTARFTDQIITEPISQRGDSGALVLNEQGNAVGLLFSGSDVISVCNPIQAVLDGLDVTLVTQQM